LDRQTVSERLREREEEDAIRLGQPIPPFREYSNAELQAASDRHHWNLERMGEAAIATTDNLGPTGYNFDPAGNYCKADGRFGFGGTSAAAAQVAGVVTLMLAAYPALIGHPDVVLDMLRRSANKDCFPEGVDPAERGHGLVDAAAAVEEAENYSGTANLVKPVYSKQQSSSS
jgi:subtilisin family serine protease